MDILRIFYSWQSDLPSDTNKETIRDILTTAKHKIEQDGTAKNIIVDDATRDEVGAVSIPQSIINKINAADIFVCDLSIINPTAITDRKTPNPNVMYELGYAVSILGWERVLILFNTEFGQISDVPFDVDRQRINMYSIKENPTTAALKSLTANYGKGDIYKFLDAIIKKDPSRPSENDVPPKEEVERQRDILQIETFLSFIYWPLIDEYLKEIPHRYDADIHLICEPLHHWFSSSSAFLYDKELATLIIDFCSAFFETQSHINCYNLNHVSSFANWDNPGDMPLSKEKQESWDHIEQERSKMNTAKNDLLNNIRNNYMEIHIETIEKEDDKKLKEEIEVFKRKKSGNFVTQFIEKIKG